jgi:hypothetical protein
VRADAGTVVTGNPLHGVQVMRFEALDGWLNRLLPAARELDSVANDLRDVHQVQFDSHDRMARDHRCW